MIKILFIGSGAFGSALANAFLSKKNNDVKVFFYAVDPSEYKDILQQKNSRYFGDLKFGRKIDFISLNLAECAAKNPDYIFLACPSKFIGANVHEIVKLIKKPPILINIAKGFGENGTLWTDWFKANYPQLSVVSLAGPSYADEVYKLAPTIVNIASNDQKTLDQVKLLFTKAHENLKVVPFELCDVMQMLSICKNIYAILMGMFWAKYQSQNTQYAVFTNICKELFKTFDSAIFSYAGIGDLCLTATQAKSRNFQYGMALINKKAVAHATVEGVTAASYLLDHSCKRLPCNKKLPLLFKTAQLIAKPENIASELIKIFNQLG